MAYVYDALKILIDLSEKAQNEHFNDNNVYNSTQFLKEFCTIKLKTARQTGHTESIFNLLKDKGLNIFYIYMSRQLGDMFLNKYEKYYEKEVNYDMGNYSILGRIIDNCVFGNLKTRLMGKSFDNIDAIVVDNYSFLPKEKEEFIYHNLVTKKSNDPFFIIFLQ
jgi:hypothetical protein